MSREIRFRAWDKADRFMMHNVYLNRVDMEKLDFKRALEGSVHTVNLLCDDIVVMQYTGLKDKNGKEIYEGDVLKIIHGRDPSRYNGEYAIYQIVADLDTLEGYHTSWQWVSGYGCITHIIEDEGEYGEEIVNAEVIGNLYQHPDLLKEAPSV